MLCFVVVYGAVSVNVQVFPVSLIPRAVNDLLVCIHCDAPTRIVCPPPEMKMRESNVSSASPTHRRHKERVEAGVWGGRQERLGKVF